VEVVTAGLMLAAWVEYGPGVEFVRTALLCALLVVLIFTDLTVRRIPHAVTLFGTVSGLLLSLIAPVDDRPLEWLLGAFGACLQGRLSSFLGALSGAAFGAGLFYLVGKAFARLRKKQGLGFGDVTLIGMVGAFLGIPVTYVIILLGSLAASVVAGLLYVASPRFRHDYSWPYGAFLGAAAIYASLGGTELLNRYLNWRVAGP